MPGFSPGRLDLSVLPHVSDGGAELNVNLVDTLRFKLRDERQVRRQAIAQAARDARADAEAIAESLGLHVDGALQAQTGDAESAPVAMQSRGPSAAQSVEVTPVEPAAIQIQATVTVTLQTR